MVDQSGETAAIVVVQIERGISRIEDGPYFGQFFPSIAQFGESVFGRDGKVVGVVERRVAQILSQRVDRIR